MEGIIVVVEHHDFPFMYLKAQVKLSDFTVLMRLKVKNVAQQTGDDVLFLKTGLHKC